MDKVLELGKPVFICCKQIIALYIKDEEKKKTEKAFHDFLPPSVVKDIKSKRVLASTSCHK